MPVSPVTPAVRTSDLSLVTCHLPLRRGTRRAFTLLELLVVIGIIAILSGIVLGVGRRASESGKIARAKAEMAALSTALEAYKSQYGDYPQTADSARLLQSLLGKLGPLPASPVIAGRALIESAKFVIALPATPTVPVDPFTNNTAVLIDPWDHPYAYAFNTTASGWTNSSFVLYSPGPDGLLTALPATGLINDTAANNADNLYANRN
ncbi:MAG: prepilin-type N-terminal cleavage/methylation domain-containing protein [Opitutae bacterium]|nr:prepilin-type N-terminal cleavage/methylation domain-containing protein [Opitutae bacterium]